MATSSRTRRRTPKYGAFTGVAWPGVDGLAISWLKVYNQLDVFASKWHDTQDVLGDWTAQMGWIGRVWTGRDGDFGLSDIAGLGPYGQAIRLTGTVGFALGAGFQLMGVGAKALYEEAR